MRKRNLSIITIGVSVPGPSVARLGNHTNVIRARHVASTQVTRKAVRVNSQRSSLDYMPWWKYVEQVARGDTQARIGARIGVTGPSIGRWSKGALPDPSTAAAFAREYGRPVLEAFVAAGFLTAEEAKQRPSQRHSITAYDDDELVKDISRRLTQRKGERDAQAKPKQKIVNGDGQPVMPPPVEPPRPRARGQRPVLGGQDTDPNL